MSYYYAYRLFLNDTNSKGVASLFREQKETFFKDSVLSLIEKKRITISQYGESHIFHKEKLTSDLYLWQIAKTKQFNKSVIKENKIEDIPDTQYPYVFAIISLKTQIVLIQNDSSVFPEVRSIANKLEYYFNDYLSQYKINVRLNEIADKNDIDYEMKQFESITTIDMSFSPPNFFGGEKDIDKIVNDIHDDTGFDKLKIAVTNSLEGLNVNRKKVASFLSRLASGAGNYVVKGFKDGLKTTIKSINFQAKKRYDDIEKTDVNVLEEDIDTLNNLNEGSDEEE